MARNSTLRDDVTIKSNKSLKTAKLLSLEANEKPSLFNKMTKNGTNNKTN